MNYTQVVLFSTSIFLVTAIAWIRFKRTGFAFFPFMLCISLASLNEILSYILTANGYSTAVNNNIYVLFESMLICWQFRKWGLFSQGAYWFWVVLALLLITWFAESCIIYNIQFISSWFRIIYALLIVLLSIRLNNRLLITSRNGLLKNPVFLTCAGFIIFFTYKILVEAFWLYGLNAGKDFRIHVYLLLTWINLFVNLIYTLAFLWIPKKPNFITLY